MLGFYGFRVRVRVKDLGLGLGLTEIIRVESDRI